MIQASCRRLVAVWLSLTFAFKTTHLLTTQVEGKKSLQGCFQTTYVFLTTWRPYLYAIVHYVHVIGPFETIDQATVYALFWIISCPKSSSQ